MDNLSSTNVQTSDLAPLVGRDANQSEEPVDKPRLAANLPAPLRALYFNSTSRVVRMRYEELRRDLADEAQDLIDKGRFEEARDLVQRDPAWDGSYLGHLLVGNSLFGLEQYEAAAEQWEIADCIRKLVNAQRGSVLRNNQAMARLMRKDYSAAIGLCDDAIDCFAEWPGPWVTKLSAMNLDKQQANLERVFMDMDRLWPEWRSNNDVAKSLVSDPHLTGVKGRIPPQKGL